MNEPNVKCRVCWEDKEKKNCIVLSAKWGVESTKSIKEIILLCVPWMSVEDKNLICKPCLWQLKFTYKFVERCLKTENILNEAKHEGIDPLCLDNIFKISLENSNKIQIILENPESTGARSDQEPNVELLESVQKNNENAQNIDVQNEVNVDSLPATAENEAIVNPKINITDKNDVSEHNHYIKKGIYISNETISSLVNSVQADLLIKSGDQVEPAVLNENEDTPKQNALDDSNYTCNDFGRENTSEEADASRDSVSGMISDPPTESVEKTLGTGKSKKSTKKNVTHFLDPPVKNELTDLLDIAPVDIWFITSRCEVNQEQHDRLISDGINMLNLSKDPTKKKRTIFLSRDLELKSYQCVRGCQDKFRSRNDYLDHMHLHRKGKIPGYTVHTCQACSETFGYDRDFRNHSRMFHGISHPHLCTKCNKRFRTLNLFKDHKEQFKDQEKCILKCKRCEKVFYKLSSWQHHEDDVKDAPCCNYHKCRVCSKKFTKEEFKVHCREVHRNYLCPECGKSFPGAVCVTSHLRNVHNRIESMCHECGKILSNPRNLQYHIQTVHGSKKFNCDKCSRSFTSIVYLRHHSKVHSDINKKKRFKCEKCGKEYVSRDGLLCHERLVHLKMKRFTCHICNEGFLRNDYFQRHLKTHIKNSRYSCPVCRKCFPVDWRLEIHMQAGHDENGKPLEMPDELKKARRKKYTYPKYTARCVCKICKKILANTSVLNLHYRSHLKLRTFKCSFCEITFQTKMSLSRHEKLHTDPNFEFSCNICHAYTSSSAALESHILKVHKTLKYKCQLCSEAFGRKHLLADHETSVHEEDNKKKEMILNILEKDHIYVKDGERYHATNKGKKLGTLEIDIHKFYDDLVNKKNVLGHSASTSQDINTEEKLQTDVQGTDVPVQGPGKKKVRRLKEHVKA